MFFLHDFIINKIIEKINVIDFVCFLIFKLIIKSTTFLHGDLKEEVYMEATKQEIPNYWDTHHLRLCSIFANGVAWSKC